MALIYGFIWWRERDQWANLLFTLAALGTAALAWSDLALMHAESPAQFGVGDTLGAILLLRDHSVIGRIRAALSPRRPDMAPMDRRRAAGALVVSQFFYRTKSQPSRNHQLPPQHLPRRSHFRSREDRAEFVDDRRPVKLIGAGDFRVGRGQYRLAARGSPAGGNRGRYHRIFRARGSRTTGDWSTGERSNRRPRRACSTSPSSWQWLTSWAERRCVHANWPAT